MQRCPADNITSKQRTSRISGLSLWMQINNILPMRISFEQM